MNKKYRLVSGELITYLNIERQENGNLNFHHLNAIAIILLLYYMGNEKEYISIKDALNIEFKEIGYIARENIKEEGEAK